MADIPAAGPPPPKIDRNAVFLDRCSGCASVCNSLSRNQVNPDSNVTCLQTQQQITLGGFGSPASHDSTEFSARWSSQGSGRQTEGRQYPLVR